MKRAYRVRRLIETLNAYVSGLVMGGAVVYLLMR